MWLDWLGAIVVFAAVYFMFFARPEPTPEDEEHLDRDW